MSSNPCNIMGWRPSNGRTGMRMAAWLAVKSTWMWAWDCNL